MAAPRRGGHQLHAHEAKLVLVPAASNPYGSTASGPPMMCSVFRRPSGVEAQLLRRLGDDMDACGARRARRSRQDDPDVYEHSVVRQRVLAATVARLATIDPDGRPHLVPIVFVLDGETLYSAVDAKPKRSRALRRIENARERPDVTVLIDHYEDDWERLWWVRLRGRARVLDGGEEAQRALGLLANKYEQYQRERPDSPVLAIDIAEWRGWDASDSPRGPR
jgi:PPOX class probable F420-dependent enzyme